MRAFLKLRSLENVCKGKGTFSALINHYNGYFGAIVADLLISVWKNKTMRGTCWRHCLHIASSVFLFIPLSLFQSLITGVYCEPFVSMEAFQKLSYSHYVSYTWITETRYSLGSQISLVLRNKEKNVSCLTSLNVVNYTIRSFQGWWERIYLIKLVYHSFIALPAAIWKEEMASSRPTIVCRLLRVPIWE